MNAKTKEKKTIMKALLGGEADILVVDPIRYRQMADIKNKEFYEVEKDKECKEEKKVPGLTDAELLCCDIAIHIAHKTAARFEDMADGMEMSTLKQIVRRIEDSCCFSLSKRKSVKEQLLFSYNSSFFTLSFFYA